MNENLLSIQDLCVGVLDGDNYKLIVDRLSLNIKKQTIMALVGGSGSGKTTTGLSIIRLLASVLTTDKGKIFFQGEDLLNYSGKQMQKLRGKEIGMVFQEPLTAFNPVFKIGDQIEEVLRFHTGVNRRQRRQRVWELLEIVGMPEPKLSAENYPHQLSGGMRQRAMIAQAIAAEPKLIIADEPTSNLDVTLQARIMELFRSLKERLNLSVLLITHDLGMVNHLADEVAVMEQGRIVERGVTSDIINNPRHPYTQSLMDALQMR